MSRQQTKQANALVNTTSTNAAADKSNLGQLYNTLQPEYSKMATNPTGYGAGDLSAINTAGQQSVAGSLAKARGTENMSAVRTGNSGALQGTVDEAAREGMRRNSQNALEVQGKNADVKQQQQQTGLAGLAKLYGMNEEDLAKMLGIQNEAINTGVNAGKSGWLQNTLNIANTLTGAGKAYNDV